MRRYIEALIDALRPGGDVLQVGFLPFVAEQIQTYHPKSHTILEWDAIRLQEAREWTSNTRVHLIEESWRQALPRLGVFDQIFLAVSEEEVPQIVKTAQKLIQDIEAQIPSLSKMRYSDADLEALCEQSATSFPEQLFYFLHELEHNGQIETEQKRRMIRKFKLKGTSIPLAKIDSSVPLLQACLALHMRKNSRFTCLLENFTSKYEDPRFFEQIIVNPLVEYREWKVSIPKKGEALVILVEKQ